MKLPAALLILLLTPALASAPGDTGDDHVEDGQEATETDRVRAAQGGAGQDPREPLEEFVPSEEVSADRPVSFPKDI